MAKNYETDRTGSGYAGRDYSESDSRNCGRNSSKNTSRNASKNSYGNSSKDRTSDDLPSGKKRRVRQILIR